MSLAASDPTGDYDHDGLGSTKQTFTGQLGTAKFQSLVELQAKTTEKHAVELTLSVFSPIVMYPGVPFPAIAFMTFPTKNPNSLSFPDRYSATLSGLAAITASTAASIVEVSVT